VIVLPGLVYTSALADDRVLHMAKCAWAGITGVA
jgi:hypothetical protein